MQFIINNLHLFAALAVIVFLLLAGPINRFIHGVKTITPAQAVLLLNREGGVVVDVCEANEFRAGHIPHAVNIPLPGLKGQVKDLEKYRNKPVVVSCRSGNRSVRGAVTLRRQGFASVYSLAGGLAAWEKDNLPLEK